MDGSLNQTIEKDYNHMDGSLNQTIEKDYNHKQV
jgi:hypothetical protein